jgi:hypothetical protein
MFLRLDVNTVIEDLRSHSAEMIEKLRQLLGAGAEALPDPKRPHFYDIRNCTRTYFIHISPISGKVMLLASWNHGTKSATEANGQAA